MAELRTLLRGGEGVSPEALGGVRGAKILM